MRIGVMGMGRMGAPIARRLRAQGHLVTPFDLDPARAAQLAPELAPPPLVPNGPTSAAEDRFGTSGIGGDLRDLEVLVTVLPGPAELRSAMQGARTATDASGGAGGGRARDDDVRPTPPGALGRLREGTLWIDLTSGDPRVARELAHAAAERGVLAVGAPMAGGPADAEAGTLGFFVGGAPAAVDRALPVLAAIGDPARLERAGDDVGAGHVAKLLANTLWFGQVAAVVEVLLIGQAQGLEPEQLAGILRRSAGGSAFLDRHLDALLGGDYLETFGIDRVVEELDTVTELAAEAGLPIPVTRLVAALHREALERFGPVDGELLVAKLLEQNAGTRIRRTGPR